MAQAGVNPHAAADLLRQAMAHNSAKYEGREDYHDQIGSNSPTPSGIETPRPDFHDKRLPGIMHSYFGQVGRNSSTRSPSQTAQAVSTPDVDFGVESHPPKHVREAEQSHTPATTTGSLINGEHTAGSEANHDTEPTKLQEAGETENAKSTGQPSSPISSDPCEIQNDGEAAENGMPLADGGIASITQALRNFVRPKSILYSKNHRHQSLPLSSVDTNPVPAAHISNPTSTTQSPRSSNPAFTPPLSEKLETSPSVQELSKLTLDAAFESRDKNTPPLTPRALSHEDRLAGARSPLSTNRVQTSEETQNSHSRGSNIAKEQLPSSTARGKLVMTIAEGRNLKPSLDPYCICVFEWNEYITKGPKNDKMDIDEPAEEKKAVKSNLSSIMMRRTDSETGRTMAIPMRSRQSSTNGMNDDEKLQTVSDPKWDVEATFDVTEIQSDIDISVYDRRAHQDMFLGHVRFSLNLTEQQPSFERWLPLKPLGTDDQDVSGEILVKMQFTKIEKKHFGPNDFHILKLIGKGTFGQVYQVRKKDTQRIYAMKVLSKKVIIQKKEIAHTIGERNILVRTATGESPFIVGLKFSFQTATDLYLVTDFMSGGELFWHLQKEGRFKEDRAKFYIAELILALKHLHEHDIVYRDLKPENILLDANGHIALCDFGLSKANLTQNDTTNTFCGTTEYLAPEVLLDEQGYTKMVDFWSLGVLVFEMCCGWSPFYAEDTQQMYKNIAFGKVRFPRDALSTEGRNFVKGLLNRNPKHRLGANRDAQELIEHPFFADIDWDALARKNLVPPFKPKLSSDADTSHFDPEFTNALNTSSSLNARAIALAGGAQPASTPLSPTMQNAFRGFTFVDDSALEQQFGGQDDEIDEPLQRVRTRDRMSGIQRTNTTGDDIFGGDDWNM